MQKKKQKNKRVLVAHGPSVHSWTVDEQTFTPIMKPILPLTKQEVDDKIRSLEMWKSGKDWIEKHKRENKEALHSFNVAFFLGASVASGLIALLYWVWVK